MRKAVQAAARRNQRRKENPPTTPPAEAPTNVGAVSKEQQQPPPTTASTRALAVADVSKRKATPEEAALTAKNYRLAKELVSEYFWFEFFCEELIVFKASFVLTPLCLVALTVGIASKASRRM